jgi:hypothetical protein
MLGRAGEIHYACSPVNHPAISSDQRTLGEHEFLSRSLTAPRFALSPALFLTDSGQCRSWTKVHGSDAGHVLCCTFVPRFQRHGRQFQGWKITCHFQESRILISSGTCESMLVATPCLASMLKPRELPVPAVCNTKTSVGEPLAFRAQRGRARFVVANRTLKNHKRPFMPWTAILLGFTPRTPHN